jgi:D-arginine dehydrogenase
MNASTAEILVIGGGIAGASAAAELAGSQRVVLLEAEAQPGYHATGRSAALFFQNYGSRPIRKLTAGSRRFFDEPPEGFAEHPLLAPRGVLIIAREDQLDHLAQQESEASGLERISGEQARQLVPLLRPEAVHAALYEPTAQDIDVNALHLGYLKRFRARGGTIAGDARVEAMRHDHGVWRVTTRAGHFEAPVVVNAAGAWADEVAALAGLPRVGLSPRRRTAVIVEGPPERAAQSWPLTTCAAESFYFKPESGGKLMISPADETPDNPNDAQPDEMDIAIAVDRFMTAVDLEVRRIEHSWAGLRTFTPDRTPVVGWADGQRDSGFFWLAGQGGYGIQTAPAMAMLTAALVTDGEMPEPLRAQGLDLATLSPERF